MANRTVVLNMDWLTILVVVLLVFWGIGFLFAATAGGLLHFLLVIAVVLIVVRLVRGQSL